jgi:hypothetical protein
MHDPHDQKLVTSESVENDVAPAAQSTDVTGKVGALGPDQRMPPHSIEGLDEPPQVRVSSHRAIMLLTVASDTHEVSLRRLGEA